MSESEAQGQKQGQIGLDSHRMSYLSHMILKQTCGASDLKSHKSVKSDTDQMWKKKKRTISSKINHSDDLMINYTGKGGGWESLDHMFLQTLWDELCFEDFMEALF